MSLTFFHLKCKLSGSCSYLLIFFFNFFFLPEMIPAELYWIVCYHHHSTQHFSEPQSVGIIAQAKQAWGIDICMLLDSEPDRGSPGSSLLYNISLILKVPRRKDPQEIKCFSRLLKCFPFLFFLKDWRHSH